MSNNNTTLVVRLRSGEGNERSHCGAGLLIGKRGGARPGAGRKVRERQQNRNEKSRRTDQERRLKGSLRSSRRSRVMKPR
jgi:hypothetical protein